ncbi:hypothetical protein V3C99_012187 [Haemonchus contortus]|uniref:RNA-directed DNA polymerase n=1 Tax=Haemonchus contortus TaxID=6289 RepID=A0A7I4Y4T8_HAECO
MPIVRYLGFILDKDGHRPDPEKTEAVRQMPVPRNVAEVRSFLGMINYYGSFVAEMRQIRASLDELLKKNVPFRWTSKCDEAFKRAKEVLSSDLLLTHFDPSLEIIVAADASDYGIGAVILHKMPDGTEKAICHASRSLNTAEKNYGQIEKEGLALIFAVRKFHRYIYGRQFKLLTDHKPLLHIFGPKKMVPIYTANRLQRWKLILMGYDFSLEYRSTTEFGQADALSRLIPAKPNQTEDVVIAKIEQEILAVYETTIRALPVTRILIQDESEKDEEIVKVTRALKQGVWPSKPGKEVQNWKALRHTLSVQDGCLYFGHRIVVPKSLRGAVLKQLHDGHPGMTRMKMLARRYVYWTNINKDIEENVQKCRYCQETAKMARKTVLCSWPDETKPWNRVHIDFAGPINGKVYLVVVDSYSKWPEVLEMSSSTVKATLRELKMLFARFGNSSVIVSDNGTQFTSREFQEFYEKQGIEHIRSPPFHPQSNGQAERFVDTLKRALLKSKGGEKSELLAEFLKCYRKTPSTMTPKQLSPAELFLGRQLRTTLTLLKEELRNEKGSGKTEGWKDSIIFTMEHVNDRTKLKIQSIFGTIVLDSKSGFLST